MPEKRKTAPTAKVAENNAAPPSPPAKRAYTKVQKIYAKSTPSSVKSAGRQGSNKFTQDASPTPKDAKKKSALPILRDEIKHVEDLLPIRETGVLDAAVNRSRSKWLHEDIFERYWTRPMRKKGQLEVVPNNPPAKESMHLIGPCRFIIEPHVFDATLYAIRETPARPATPATPATNPPSKPNVQYQAPPPTSSTPTQQQTKPSPSPSANPPIQTAPKNPPATNSTPHHLPPLGSQSQSRGSLPPLSSVTANPPPQPPQHKTSQDPVIQMLAQRASANPSLKELMKVVASGAATKEQLATFQSHIDDLTSLHQRQQQQAQNAANRLPPVAMSPYNNTTPTPSRVQQPQPQPQHRRPQPHQLHPAQAAQPPPKPSPPPQPFLTGVAFDFPSATTHTRLLFPKHSILEYSPDRRSVKVSFLLVRRASRSDTDFKKGGDSACGADMDPAAHYHTPLTITLAASDPKILEPLAKIVSPSAEMQKHMADAVVKTLREPLGTLALRTVRRLDLGDEAAPAPAAGDRRSSLLRGAGVRASPGVGRRRAAVEVSWENRCRECYAPVAGAKGEEGVEVRCASCRRLWVLSAGGGGGEGVNFIGGRGREARGPGALMLGRGL